MRVGQIPASAGFHSTCFHESDSRGRVLEYRAILMYTPQFRIEVHKRAYNWAVRTWIARRIHTILLSLAMEIGWTKWQLPYHREINHRRRRSKAADMAITGDHDIAASSCTPTCISGLNNSPNTHACHSCACIIFSSEHTGMT